jgi:hypothetical protein
VRSTYLRNKELDALDNVAFSVTTVYASLHTGNPGITGANEATGGSYARQSVSLGAAASGASSNDVAINFTGMPAVGAPGLTHVGLWDAVSAGNFLWAGPLGTRDVRAFTAADTGDLFTSFGHGLLTTDMVDLVTLFDSVLPTGVSALTNYYVVSPTATTTFQVSTTSGGSAVVLTANGAGMVRRIQPKLVNAGDTVNIAIAALALAQV